MTGACHRMPLSPVFVVSSSGREVWQWGYLHARSMPQTAIVTGIRGFVFKQRGLTVRILTWQKHATDCHCHRYSWFRLQAERFDSEDTYMTEACHRMPLSPVFVVSSSSREVWRWGYLHDRSMPQTAIVTGIRGFVFKQRGLTVRILTWQKHATECHCHRYSWSRLQAERFDSEDTYMTGACHRLPLSPAFVVSSSSREVWQWGYLHDRSMPQTAIVTGIRGFVFKQRGLTVRILTWQEHATDCHCHRYSWFRLQAERFDSEDTYMTGACHRMPLSPVFVVSSSSREVWQWGYLHARSMPQNAIVTGIRGFVFRQSGLTVSIVPTTPRKQNTRDRDDSSLRLFQVERLTSTKETILIFIYLYNIYRGIHN